MKLIVRDSPNRIQLIDGLRGLSILLMIVHHFAVDLVLVAGAPAVVSDNWLFGIFSPVFAGLFILLSGISCRLSHSNLRRGLEMLLFALGITVVTSLIGMPVRFGIVHLLGLSALLYHFLRKPLDAVPRPVAIICYVALFAVSLVLTRPHYDIPHLWWLGIRQISFVSYDYFPLLPWFFLYLTGTWLGKPIAERKLPERFYALRIRFFPTVGRNTLWIYLLHQPVIYGICLLLRQIIAP